MIGFPTALSRVPLVVTMYNFAMGIVSLVCVGPSLLRRYNMSRTEKSRVHIKNLIKLIQELNEIQINCIKGEMLSQRTMITDIHSKLVVVNINIVVPAGVCNETIIIPIKVCILWRDDGVLIDIDWELSNVVITDGSVGCVLCHFPCEQEHRS